MRKLLVILAILVVATGCQKEEVDYYGKYYIESAVEHGQDVTADWVKANNGIMVSEIVLATITDTICESYHYQIKGDVIQIDFKEYTLEEWSAEYFIYSNKTCRYVYSKTGIAWQLQ